MRTGHQPLPRGRKALSLPSTLPSQHPSSAISRSFSRTWEASSHPTLLQQHPPLPLHPRPRGWVLCSTWMEQEHLPPSLTPRPVSNAFRRGGFGKNLQVPPQHPPPVHPTPSPRGHQHPWRPTGAPGTGGPSWVNPPCKKSSPISSGTLLGKMGTRRLSTGKEKLARCN